jgi:hypothetical protein
MTDPTYALLVLFAIYVIANEVRWHYADKRIRRLVSAVVSWDEIFWRPRSDQTAKPAEDQAP